MSVYAWFMGGVVSLAAVLPQSITGLLYIAAILTITDTLTGFGIARRKGQVRSFTMREKLAAKSKQFMIILAMGTCGSIATRSWVAFGLSMSALIVIEFTSNLENLAWLENNGGAPLGPAKPVIMKLAQILGIGPLEEQERNR